MNLTFTILFSQLNFDFQQNILIQNKYKLNYYLNIEFIGRMENLESRVIQLDSNIKDLNDSYLVMKTFPCIKVGNNLI